MADHRPRQQLLDVKEIVAMLSARAGSVVAQLYGINAFGKARVMLGDVTGNPGQSLSIIMKPGVKGGCKPGDWRDFGEAAGKAEHGDILTLIAQARCGGDIKEAIIWARKFLGLDDCTPGELAVQVKRAQEQRQRQEKEAAAAELRRIGAARKIFLDAQADLTGTPVDHYLMGRGIDIRKLPSTGACRFHPDCLLQKTGELLPAMVLAIVGGDGRLSAVHRTYLEQKGGRWQVIRDEHGKALKMSLGALLGGHVSVSKGASDVPLGRAPQGDRVLIGEGYETTCSYALACPGLRCIAAGSLSNMAAVKMPPTVTTRYLVRENFMGEQAMAQFQRAVEAHMQQCPDVRIVETAPGYSDANDVLQGKMKAG